MPSSPGSDRDTGAGRVAVSDGAHDVDEAESGAHSAERAPPDPGRSAEELARSEERYKRALADLDNYRKRVAREIETRVEDATDSVLRDWLEVVDSIERAMRMEPDGPCADGLRAVTAQIDGVLARAGAQRIGAAGDRFDPERHEAIAVRPSGDAPDGTVLEVQRPGYLRGDRVVRPAQVVVASAPEQGP
jgi:molecular chaperone GrpE